MRGGVQLKGFSHVPKRTNMLHKLQDSWVAEIGSSRIRYQMSSLPSETKAGRTARQLW